MVRHESLARMADRKITKHGRTVSLIQTATVAPDPTKPWRTAPGVGEIASVRAVLDNFTLEEIDNDHVQRGDKKAYVSPLTSLPLSPENFDKLVDPVTGTWAVRGAEIIRPGETNMLAILHLRQ